MKTDTKEKILTILSHNSALRPAELSRILKISTQALHRQLKSLVQEKKIIRIGSAPNTFYKALHQTSKENTDDFQITDQAKNFLDLNYTYISPEGRILNGLEGFSTWCKSIRETKRQDSLIKEYMEIAQKAISMRSSDDWIEASERIKSIFPEIHLDRLIYKDFYSLPKFGKTRLGVLTLHGKSAQDLATISLIAQMCKATIERIISQLKCDAVAYVPHSIPRKISFLKEFAKNLNLPLPRIELVKAYSGEIPIAQKSLSKLEERVLNARNTIYPLNINYNHQRILLIDDAVGSGASLNETAAKLKQNKKVKFIVGFAIVGSYKGFEVINEI